MPVGIFRPVGNYRIQTSLMIEARIVKPRTFFGGCTVVWDKNGLSEGKLILVVKLEVVPDCRFA